MNLNQFCTYCKKRCEKQVYWRPVNGIEQPFCSIKHWMDKRKESENETQMADQNEALQTSSEVLPADKPHVKHALGKATQATFEDLNFFW